MCVRWRLKICRRNLNTGSIEFARVIKNFNPFESVYPHYFNWYISFENGTHFPQVDKIIRSLVQNETNNMIIYEAMNDDGTIPEPDDTATVSD